jgi:hypothetical protein
MRSPPENGKNLSNAPRRRGRMFAAMMGRIRVVDAAPTLKNEGVGKIR